MPDLIPIDEVVHFDVCTHDPATGAITDADATPTFDVYEEATDTGLLGATNFTKRTSLTGNYRGTFTASAANGFEAGKWYNVIASAAVNSIAAKTAVLTFRCAPAESSAGVPKGDTSHWNGTAVTTPDTAGSPKVTVTAGTGAGQLDFTSGVLKSNLVQILGTVLTETAGQIAAAFKKFFDKSSPTGTINSIPDAVAGAAGGLFIAGSNAATTVNITGDLTGNVSGSVGSVAAGGITAASFAANAINAAKLDPDVTTELQAGLATAAALTTVEGKIDTIDNFVDTEMAATLAAVDTEVAAIKVVTDALPNAGALTTIQADLDNIQTRIPAALNGGRMDSDLGALVGSTTAAARLQQGAIAVETGAAAAGTLSTTQMTTNLTETTNDHYNGRMLIWTSGVLLRQATEVTDYDGASKMLTYVAITEAPTAADTFILV